MRNLPSMDNNSEGKVLYDIVRGRAYTGEVKSEIMQRGLKRIGGTQWLSLATGTKYEFLLTQNGDEQFVSRIDVIERDHRIHLADVGDINSSSDNSEKINPLDNVHHKTIGAFCRQVEQSKAIYETLNQWNEEIGKKSTFGLQLQQITQVDLLSWEDLTFLPDPLGSGQYIFGVRRTGKVAAMRAWLNLPGGEFIMPLEMTTEGIIESATTGLEFHNYEVENFDRPAQAVKYAVQVLNASHTVYAQCIRKMINKIDAPITRNDFHRNNKGEHCRLEVEVLPSGVVFHEVPIVPTLADAIDSLLAEVIRQRYLSNNGK